MWKYIWLLLLLGLWACDTRGDSPGQEDQPDVRLATYSVTPGMQEAIRDILNQNFSTLSGKGDGYIARVEVLPNGQLVLIGPAHIHEGMKELVASLKTTAPPPVENSSLSFWMVLARPAERSAVSPGLSGLEEVLQAIEPAQTSEFHLLEKMKITAASGTRSTAIGTFFRLSYGLHKSPGNIVADLDIRGEHGIETRLTTQIYLKPDQYIVLGQSRYWIPDEQIAQALDDMETGYYTLFYILKADTQ